MHMKKYSRPYRKPTQVNRSRRPRHTGNDGSRNSAKKLSVSFAICSGGTVWYPLQQKFVNRLFSKNTGSCKPENGTYRS